MTRYRFSGRATSDLEAIADFTIRRFGVDQARRYRDELSTCFSDLAKNPSLGRRAEQLAKGLRRFEHGSHIVFYVADDHGVLIVRVLHYRMDVRRHF